MKCHDSEGGTLVLVEKHKNIYTDTFMYMAGHSLN